MSDDVQSDQKKPAVSSTRKIVSGVLLLIVVVLAAFEGRAGFSYSSATKKLQEMAPSGRFDEETVTRKQIEAMMPMSPTISEVDDTPFTVECKYSWTSVIRPLVGTMPETAVFVTYSNEDPQHAISFGTAGAEASSEPVGGAGDADSSDDSQ